MEGDARDQLQPQPRIIGEVGADLSTQRVFCAPDNFGIEGCGLSLVPFLISISSWPRGLSPDDVDARTDLHLLP